MPAWAAQSAATQEDPERARAFQLYQDAKYAEALPAFEKLAAKYPEDRDVIKTYGYLVLSQNAYVKDAASTQRSPP